MLPGPEFPETPEMLTHLSAMSRGPGLEEGKGRSRQLRKRRCHRPYLNRFVEFDTKVSKYLKAFVQLHGFFVFTEKIYKGVGLLLELLSPVLQFRQLFHSELREDKRAHAEVSGRPTRRWASVRSPGKTCSWLRFQVSGKGGLF